MTDGFRAFWASHSTFELWWIAVGFAAQGLFSARFLVQILASEKARRSVVPDAFWYLSILGGALLLAYAIHRQDPVFILGQAFGLVVYSRNLYFLRVARRAALVPDDR